MKLQNLNKTLVLILCLLVGGYACSRKNDNPIASERISDFTLAKTSVVLNAGETVTVKILSGNGDYKMNATPTDIVTATAVGNEISIKGLKKGTTKITITDTKNKTAVITAEVGEAIDPADADGKFSLAILGDTQEEVYKDKISLFKDRTKWIVEQKDALDIRGVLHMGDVVNWDNAPIRIPWTTADHCQYEYAAQALQTLRDAKLPTLLCVGNHDNMATGGTGCDCVNGVQTGSNCGSARSVKDGGSTYDHLRMTQSFNYYLYDSKLIPTWVPFENDKVDNGYYTFEAAGAKWLAITLELWPRTVVTNWVKGVIASNPDKNVIIQSHYIFNTACNVATLTDFREKYEYGDNSPALLWKELVEPYPNVKIVLSGHVTGYECSKLITLPNGNKVIGAMTDIEKGGSFINPTRILEIDVKKGTAKTYVYTVLDKSTTKQKDFIGLNFIKK